MKKLLFIAIALVLSLAIFHSCNEPLTEDPTSDELSLKSASNAKSYIVVLNDAELNAELSNLKGYEMRQQAAKKAAEKVMKRAGITDGELGFVYGTAIKGFSVKIPPGQLKKLQDDPSVKYIEEDQVITLIEPKAKPGDGDVQASAAQETPWGITRVKGGATYGGLKVAWVIDTGIDLDHPDLNVDGSRGATFVRGDSPDDDNGHGSHVAGTIAAIDNTEGVIGVAAGATVIPVKVLDRRGSGTTSGVIAGINFVSENAAKGDVANMSLGGGVSETLDAAVYNASEKDIYFSLAAGNESDDANNHSPARVNGNYIYTISAMDKYNNFASWSNYGNPPVDYCEPGVSVLSTYKDGGYTTYSGTSMAAPHMAGILIWGLPGTDGTVNGDPDVTNSTPGYADPIGVVGDATAPVNNSPVASFTYTKNNLIVDFTDTSTDSDGSVVAWSWNFGDTKTSTAQNPSHTYAAGGTYTVSLTVTDNDGATGTTSQSITVSGSSTTVSPVITNFSITNTSNPAVKRVQVNWSVTDSDGDLKTVTSTLKDPNDKTVSTSTSVTGSSANGIHELSFKKGTSGSYTVTTVVTDQTEKTDTKTDTINL